jgi:hypothetical protein
MHTLVYSGRNHATHYAYILERGTKANYRSVSCCLEPSLAIPNKSPKIIANVTSHPWRLVITYV